MTESRAGRWWPAGIVALLLVPIAANAILIHRAISDPAQAVEPDYYQKAMAWDETQAKKAASEALGWTASVTTLPTAMGELSVRLDLRDREGRPVTGAAVTVEGFAITRSADRMTATLAEAGPGTYAGLLPRSRAGLWQLAFEARAGAATYVRAERVEVGDRPSP